MPYLKLSALLLLCIPHAFACLSTAEPHRKLLGNLRGTNLTLVSHDYGENGEVRHCLAVEYLLRGRKKSVTIVEYYAEGLLNESVDLRGDKLLRKDRAMDNRSVDGEEVTTYTYTLELESGKLKLVSESITSPAIEHQNKIKKLLRLVHFREAFKEIKELDRMPNGNTYITMELFDSLTSVFLKSVKTITSPQERSQHVKKYIEAWIEENEIPAIGKFLASHHEWYKDEAPQEHLTYWNDLGYYLEQGGEVALAEKILMWVISKAPYRNVAHLNLSDVYRKMKKIELAQKHKYIYESQRANLKGKALPPRLKTMSEEEIKKWIPQKKN